LIEEAVQISMSVTAEHHAVLATSARILLVDTSAHAHQDIVYHLTLRHVLMSTNVLRIQTLVSMVNVSIQPARSNASVGWALNWKQVQWLALTWMNVQLHQTVDVIQMLLASTMSVPLHAGVKQDTRAMVKRALIQMNVN